MMAAVVKVQLPLGPDNSVQRDKPALVYDQTHRWEFLVVVDDELVAKMNGRVKAFFYATRARLRGPVVLGREAPGQEW